MITIDTCFSADVDRLLGLADQFLDDWAEDAVQGGKPDEDYEQGSTEWKVIPRSWYRHRRCSKG